MIGPLIEKLWHSKTCFLQFSAQRTETAAMVMNKDTMEHM